MKSNSTKDIGKLGESLAVVHLKQNEYEIIETNFRAGRGEIDIIARKENILAFIEVKTKKFGDFGDPIHWVTRGKQRQIGRIAQAYLLKTAITGVDFRFDVITVTWYEGTWKIKHIENAFWL